MDHLSLFKCKNCGGGLDVQHAINGVVECAYCRTLWTVPKQQTVPEAIKYLHDGNAALDVCKFVDAFTYFQKAAEFDFKEPEAYFGMALAEFKVQYLKDHVNNRLQPICHEVTEKKFTDSASFLKALRFATNEQRTEYERKGDEIDYILAEFYRLKQAGVDYDCFICVKVTDEETKQPTDDSKDADYIYRLLQDKGYKPFYSERELRNVTGADYEARILYALYTSECMLVVCRKEEYLQTPWVKNEYTRFLKLVNDEEKESDSITIVFNGTPIERLPGRNGKLQGINFALRESDGKIVGFVDKHTPVVKAKREAELRKKAEEEKRKKAEEEARRRDLEELKEQQKRLLEEQKKELAHLREQSNFIQQGTLSGAAASETQTTAGAGPLLQRMKLFLEDRDWDRAKEYAEKVLDIDPENGEAYLGELLAELQIVKFENLPKHTEPIKNLPLFKKAYRFADSDLKAQLDKAVAENEKMLEERRVAEAYNSASRRERNASREVEFLEAAKLFESISTYKDSAEHAKRCREKAEKAREEAKKRAEEAEFQRKEGIYQDACIKLQSGDLETLFVAKRTFKTIRGFKDVEAKILECDREIERIRFEKKETIYSEACQALSATATETVLKARRDFELLGDYKDCKEKVVACDARIAELKAIKEENERQAAIAAAKRKKKKIIIAIVSVVLVVAIVIAIVVAVVVNNHNEKVASAGMTYKLSTDGTHYIVNGPDKGESQAHYEIPASYHGLPVTEIGQEAFEKSNIRSITIPNTITKIENSAFYGCNKLTRATISDLTAWCKIDFDGGLSNPLCCAAHLYLNDAEIKELVIPEGITQIKPYAFYGCKGIQKVTIPTGATKIGESAFYGCNILRSITIPNSVTIIGASALNGCDSLQSITIPSGVTTIGNSAFNDCDSLLSIVIPDSVTTISKEAFAACSNIQNVRIGNGVASIGDSAFHGCGSLQSVVVDEGNKNYSSQDGILYNKNKTKIEFVPQAITGSVVIPEGVTAIGNSLFSGYSGMTAITIPASVTSIGESAFKSCSGLKTVVWNAVNCKSAGSCESTIFADCRKIIKITFGEGVKNIPAYAFSGCSGLTSITIPDGVTTIGEGAFYGCSGISSITIPNSVTSIGEGAFYGCNGLLDMAIPFVGTIKDDENNCRFDDLFKSGTSSFVPKSLKEVTVTGGTIIGAYAFNKCDSLTSIILPNTITTIGDVAFGSCSGLTSIEIPNNVTAIGDFAFQSCSGLTNIAIPDKVTTIDRYAFSGCSGLKNVTIGKSVTSIDFTTFDGCTGLESVTWNAEKYESHAGISLFMDSKNLLAVIFGNSVQTIPSCVLAGCKNLTSITIPKSVTTIMAFAFKDCSNLTEVYFANPNGWVVTFYYDDDGGTSTKLESSALSNPQIAANYLQSRYDDYEWRKG